ncbi:MAG: hypothetical protein RQ745_10100 [Longimicrobiales bacterium]|nr:hypothetical protein [Longimicrobiales bacterium]
MCEHFKSLRSMRNPGVVFALAIGSLLASAPEASAQVAWDTPLLAHPFAPEGWGIYVAETDPGDDIATFGQWRGRWHGHRVAIRAGIGEEADDDLAVFSGVDVSGSLYRAQDGDPPLALDWVSGFGLGIGEDVLVSIPLGVVAGWNIALDDATIRPYGGPRVVLDGWIGDDTPRGDDDLELEVLVDLGADFVFDPGWAIRFGATLGDRDGIAVGVALPAG